MKQALYRYKAAPSRGEMLLANDSSSFTLPFFEGAQELLSKISSLPFSALVEIYPNGGAEDAAMEYGRAHFRLTDWLLPALILNGADEISTVLLMERIHPEHALIVSMKEKRVAICCLNGVEIQEEDGPAMSGKEFLSTLSLPSAPSSFSPKRQSAPVNLGSYEDSFDEEEEEAPAHIEIELPSFVPASKKGMVNLGFCAKAKEEEDEDGEPVQVDVKKETFAPSSGKKPRNLGSIYAPKNRQTAQRSSAEEEADPERIASSFARPTFEPASKGKPLPKGPSPLSPKKETPSALPKEEPDEEKIASSYQKPSFVPNQQSKVPHAQPDFEKPLVPNQRKYTAEGRKESQNPASHGKGDDLAPCVFLYSKGSGQSRIIVNDPSLMFVSKKFVRDGQRAFSPAPSQIDSSETSFVAFSGGEAEFLPLALSPSLEEWDLLAMGVESNGMPKTYLLANRRDPLLCAVYEAKEDGLSLLVLTHNGIDVEDPALDYASLRSLCFPSEKR